MKKILIFLFCLSTTVNAFDGVSNKYPGYSFHLDDEDLILYNTVSMRIASGVLPFELRAGSINDIRKYSDNAYYSNCGLIQVDVRFYDFKKKEYYWIKGKCKL